MIKTGGGNDSRASDEEGPSEMRGRGAKWRKREVVVTVRGTGVGGGVK